MITFLATGRQRFFQSQAQGIFKYKSLESELIKAFEHSAHSPIYEEPERVKQILLNDVVNLSIDHADKNY